MNDTLFNEAEWTRLVFLLADTQAWIDEMGKAALQQVPLQHKHKLNRATYRLGIKALAHILERHYHHIPRHPGAGKFHIPIPELLHHIREAGSLEPQPVAGSLHLQRVLHIGQPVGFDKYGQPAHCLTVLTDAAGTIITALPGLLQPPGQGL